MDRRTTDTGKDMFRPHLIRNRWNWNGSTGLQHFFRKEDILCPSSHRISDLVSRKSVLVAGCGAGSLGGAGPVQELSCTYTYEDQSLHMSDSGVEAIA